MLSNDNEISDRITYISIECRHVYLVRLTPAPYLTLLYMSTFTTPTNEENEYYNDSLITSKD